MRKNGFTLVELLAVVSILSVLMLLVVPKIINQLNNSKNEINDATKEIIYSAAKKYISDNNIYSSWDYCIPISDLQSDKYLSDEMADNNSGLNISDKSVKVQYEETGGYNYSIVEKTECNQQSGMLAKELVPVAYIDNNWTVVSQTNKNNEWYNYDEQKWANAVILSSEAITNQKDQIGSIINVEGENPDALMMLVWIPRYEYKIEGTYGKRLDGTDGTSDQPGEISVNFISKNKTATAEYRIHPAFIFGDKQLDGFWIGKFELSHTTKSLGNSNTDSTANLSCSATTCDETTNLRILPNRSSLRYNKLSSFWYAIKGIDTSDTFGLLNMNSHLIKNSEWGAVAYLSQSKYGKYGNTEYTGKDKEIYQNKSSNFITGLSNGTPSKGTVNTQCAYDNITNNCGVGASTTGNIYGVYDMSGGSMEFAMGAYGTDKNPTIKSSGFTPNTIFTSEKITDNYYDIYKTTTSSSACGTNEKCYGHALSETEGWYNDMTTMVTSDSPWMIRSGYYESGNTGGIFYFYQGSGDSNFKVSTRVTFTLE